MEHAKADRAPFLCVSEALMTSLPAPALGAQQEMLVKVASVVCSLFIAVSPLQCVGSAKFTAFGAPVLFAVAVDEERRAAWAVLCVAVKQGMVFFQRIALLY